MLLGREEDLLQNGYKNTFFYISIEDVAFITFLTLAGIIFQNSICNAYLSALLIG